jgi:hypothetical protein
MHGHVLQASIHKGEPCCRGSQHQLEDAYHCSRACRCKINRTQQHKHYFIVVSTLCCAALEAFFRTLPRFFIHADTALKSEMLTSSRSFFRFPCDISPDTASNAVPEDVPCFDEEPRYAGQSSTASCEPLLQDFVC